MSQSSSDYYYEDGPFQLELNLQSSRKDLINFLDEYLFQDCLACNRVKCRCARTSSLRSTIDVLLDYRYLFYNAAPPANTLPTPRWPENINTNGHAKADKVSRKSLHNWVRASIPSEPQWNSTVRFPVPRKELNHIDYSWPPLPNSIWSEERLKETTARERLLSYEPEKGGNDSVEAFFEFFSGSRDILNTAYTFSPCRCPSRCRPGPSAHVDG